MTSVTGSTDAKPIIATQREYRFDRDALLLGAYCLRVDEHFEKTREWFKEAGLQFPVAVSGNALNEEDLDWFLENGVVAASDYTVRAMGLVTPLVRSRLGIGILAEEYVRDDIESGKLIQIKTTSLPKPRSLYIGTNHQTALSEAAREFIRHFV